jgi:group I intron endonuclease
MGIYKITCKIDGKVYVGGTSNLRLRKNNHYFTLKYGIHKNHKFQKDYDLYGKTNFEFEILEFVDDETKLDEREDYWTNKLKSNINEFGYNQRPIYVNTNLGMIYNEDRKNKISFNRLGKGTGKRYHCTETVKFKSKLCKSQNLRQYHTEETELKRIAKIREQHYDIPISEDQKQTISISNKGELNGKSKLTDNKVLEILNMLKNGESISKIMKLFDISRKSIYKISVGVSWKHITVPFIKENGYLQKQEKKNKGSNNSQSKLTEEQVIEIINILNTHKVTQRQLAEKYNVSKSTITNIARGVIWTHLSRDLC